jgi:hypothetical protein
LLPQKDEVFKCDDGVVLRREDHCTRPPGP